MNASTKSCMCAYSSRTVAEFWKEFETSTDNSISYVTLVSHNLAVRYRHKHMVCNECGGHEAVFYEDETLLAPSSSVDMMFSEDEVDIPRDWTVPNLPDTEVYERFALALKRFSKETDETLLAPSSSVDMMFSEDEVDIPRDWTVPNLPDTKVLKHVALALESFSKETDKMMRPLLSSVDRVDSEDETMVAQPCVVDMPTDNRNFMEDDHEPIPLVATPFCEILKFDEGDLL